MQAILSRMQRHLVRDGWRLHNTLIPFGSRQLSSGHHGDSPSDVERQQRSGLLPAVAASRPLASVDARCAQEEVYYTVWLPGRVHKDDVAWEVPPLDTPGQWHLLTSENAAEGSSGKELNMNMRAGRSRQRTVVDVADAVPMQPGSIGGARNDGRRIGRAVQQPTLQSQDAEPQRQVCTVTTGVVAGGGQHKSAQGDHLAAAARCHGVSAADGFRRTGRPPASARQVQCAGDILQVHSSAGARLRRHSLNHHDTADDWQAPHGFFVPFDDLAGVRVPRRLRTTHYCASPQPECGWNSWGDAARQRAM